RRRRGVLRNAALSRTVIRRRAARSGDAGDRRGGDGARRRGGLLDAGAARGADRSGGGDSAAVDSPWLTFYQTDHSLVECRPKLLAPTCCRARSTCSFSASSP